MVLREQARAKVNLTLRVPGRRSDGYHEVASLVVFAKTAADEVELTSGAPVALRTAGPFATAIEGPNIVSEALSLIAEVCPAARLGSVSIVKNLPVAAGLGGGSADAAALLRAVRLANPGLAVDWNAIGKRLGADVPACLANGDAWVTGYGDRIRLLSDLPRLRAVLVNPLVGVPADKTAQVFSTLAAAPLPPDYREPPAPDFASAGPMLEFLKSQGNDLQEAATRIVPETSRVLQTILDTPECQYAALSGAGPTSFGIFDDNETARRRIADANPGWWVVATEL